MNKLIYILLIAVLWSCSSNNKTDKKQNKRDNILNIKEKIQPVKTDVLIGSIAIPYIISEYLFIVDIKSIDKLIHIWDKNKFKYITSIAYRGNGPGEISNIGYISSDYTNKYLYVTDHGKQCIFSYNIDSIFSNPYYIPISKTKIQERLFPNWYQHINDSLALSLIINPTGNSGYNHSTAIFNVNNGEITPMKYEHPDIERKRFNIGLSIQDSVYVECHSFNDLMTICDLNGNLKYNIYGPNWNGEKNSSTIYYDNVVICNNRIIVAYSGEENFHKSKNGEIIANYPTKFLVFHTNGDYIKTLETNYEINYFCHDKQNNRIIMSLNDEIQIAYFNLNEII